MSRDWRGITPLDKMDLEAAIFVSFMAYADLHPHSKEPHGDAVEMRVDADKFIPILRCAVSSQVFVKNPQFKKFVEKAYNCAPKGAQCDHEMILSRARDVADEYADFLHSTTGSVTGAVPDLTEPDKIPDEAKGYFDAELVVATLFALAVGKITGLEIDAGNIHATCLPQPVAAAVIKAAVHAVDAVLHPAFSADFAGKLESHVGNQGMDMVREILKAEHAKLVAWRKEHDKKPQTEGGGAAKGDSPA